MPNRVSPDVTATLKRERTYNAYLRTMSPEHWEKLVDALPYHLQVAVAKIVWWDFFSERPCTEAWPHLDRYLDRKCHRLTDEEIRIALQSLGYSEYMAQERLIGIEE